jgi:hypothetical protein
MTSPFRSTIDLLRMTGYSAVDHPLVILNSRQQVRALSEEGAVIRVTL